MKTPTSTDSQSPFANGTEIGAFKIKGLVGAGGMGHVYLALQKSTGRTVALKFIQANLTATPEQQDRYEEQFKAEVNHQAQFSDPDILTVYSTGIYHDPHTAKSTPYFAMALIPQAQSLLGFVRSVNLKVEDRIALFIKVCQAVERIHSRNLIHCDLKPDNILVESISDDVRIHIIDFGLSLAVCQAVENPEKSIHRGTPRYWSPEHSHSNYGSLAAYSDIYSLGIILFEVLTDEHAFENCKSDPQQAPDFTKQPQRLGGCSLEYKGRLENIVAKTLTRDHTQRYQTLSALINDLATQLACFHLSKLSHINEILNIYPKVETTAQLFRKSGPVIEDFGGGRVYRRDEQADTIIKRLEQGENVLLLGEAASGKSVLARQIAYDLLTKEDEDWDIYHLQLNRVSIFSHKDVLDDLKLFDGNNERFPTLIIIEDVHTDPKEVNEILLSWKKPWPKFLFTTRSLEIDRIFHQPNGHHHQPLKKLYTQAIDLQPIDVATEIIRLYSQVTGIEITRELSEQIEYPGHP